MNYINKVIDNIYTQDRVYGYLFALITGMALYGMVNSYGFISLGYAVMAVVSGWLSLACLRVIRSVGND
jgi:hypothetical protein